MRRRGKAIALTATTLGLAVLVGAGIAAKDRIAEEWWIYKLRTGDEEEKKEAAQKLGEMPSLRSIPHLAVFLSQSPRVDSGRSGVPVRSIEMAGPHGSSAVRFKNEPLHPATAALVNCGPASVPILLVLPDLEWVKPKHG